MKHGAAVEIKVLLNPMDICVLFIMGRLSLSVLIIRI
jgi:hypothetical protein